MTQVVDLQNLSATPFHLDFGIKEIQVQEDNGDLLLEGYANTWATDRDNEQFVKAAFENAVDQYMLNPVVCYQHDRKQIIGRLVDRPLFNDIGVRIKALITKPVQNAPAWRKQAFDDIKRGLLRTFSVGGLFYKDLTTSPRKILGMDWWETSVVTVPANPFSIGAIAGAKGLEFGEEGDEPFSLLALLGDKAPVVQRGVGRGHGAHHRGATGRARAGRGSRRGRSSGRTRLRGRQRVAQRGSGGASSVLAAHASGIQQYQYLRSLGLKALDEDAINELLSALAKAFAAVQASDADDDAKAEALADIVDDFEDEMDNILGEPDDDEEDEGDEEDETPEEEANEEGKSTDAITRQQSVAVIGTKEHGMTTKNNQPPAGQGEPPAGEGGEGGAAAGTVTIDAKALQDLQSTVQSLKAKEREREMEVEAETKAAQVIEEEKKAEEAKAAREQAEQQELDRRVTAAVERARQAQTSGRKIQFGAPSAMAGAAAGKNAPFGNGRNLVDWLVDLKSARSGDYDAYQRLQVEQKDAVVGYGLKALGEGVQATGGFLVPPQYWQQGLAEFRIAAAKIRPLVTTIQGINSNLVFIPRETGISSVGWVAENAAKPSTDQTFGQISVPIFVLAGISKVPNQLLEDSSPAVDQIVRLDLGRETGQAEDVAMLAGTGNGQPTGILNTTGVLTVAYVAGVSGMADAINAAIVAIQSNYFGDPNAIVAHPRNAGVLRGAKDTQGRYIFTPGFTPTMVATQGGAPAFLGGDTAAPGPVGTVWGIPLVSDANMPTNYTGSTQGGGTESPVIVGKFDEAWLFERSGFVMDVSNEAGTSFESNQTWFRGEERLGFTAARQPAAFCYITGLTPTITG